MNIKNWILLVDDEADICESLAMAFEFEGFEVITACNGNEAIEKLELYPEIKLVLSDVRMPNGDGLYLLKHILKNYSKIKVVLLSGHCDKSESELLSLGASAFMSKPANLDTLIKYVQAQI